jgi:hypothetical protein
MVFIKVLSGGAAPPFVFSRCLSAPADFRLSGVLRAAGLWAVVQPWAGCGDSFGWIW